MTFLNETQTVKMLKIEKKRIFSVFEKLVKLYSREVLLVGRVDNVQFENIKSCLFLSLKRGVSQTCKKFWLIRQWKCWIVEVLGFCKTLPLRGDLTLLCYDRNQVVRKNCFRVKLNNLVA